MFKINQDRPKVNDLQWFKNNRTELYNYVINKVQKTNKKIKLVPAPVKCGKRGMVEVARLSKSNPEYVHIFLTALHRIADKKQHIELDSYGLNVFSINNKKKKDECIEFINKTLAEKKKIDIHLDELDFGCGDKQLLNNIYTKFKKDDNVNFILYSATIEVAKKEFIRPNNIDESEYEEIDKFIPPPSYYGIGKYLQNKQFKQATSFFSYDKDELKITTQGSELIEKLKEITKNKKNNADKRHIAVLRLAGNFKTNDGELKSQFETVKESKNQIEQELNIRIKFVGSKDEDVQWDNSNYWEDLESTKPFLIIINQVAGRSTEWKCHPYLCWYHTCRTDNTPTSTIIQDQERVVYYITAYEGCTIFIELYGDKPAAEYSAGEITLEQYDSMTDRKLNSRLNTKIKKDVIKVKEPMVYNSWAEIPDEYKKGRSLDSHIHEDYKLKPTMKSYDKKEKKDIQYNIKNWGKYSHLDGFYMTNVRSSRDKFIKGKSATPVWFKSDILSELKEGINQTSKIRINVFYEDGEKNPSKYKFMIREYLGSEKANVKNTSMYVN
jgi:hypothetical protein